MLPFSYQLFEQLVLNLVKVAGVVLDPKKQSANRLGDFTIHHKNTKILVEVKRGPLTKWDCNALAHILENARPRGFSRFILVTPEQPNEEQNKWFLEIFEDSHMKADWMSVLEFAHFLGIKEPLDLKSPETLAILQTAAITKDFKNYAGLIGTPPRAKPVRLNLTKPSDQPVIPSQYLDLARQFSYASLKDFESNTKTLEQVLSFGTSYTNAIVVLSDIKNFSSFVKAAQPDSLNECMAKYYRNARDLVWKHGGVLDKFIGDAVLAIFNYPVATPQAARSAVLFCAELIRLGEEVTDELKASINEIIETGTRVGISSGPLWPLNIGSAHIEVSFVGDVINLASRLEKNCDVNGILVDNRIKTNLSRTAAKFLPKLKLRSRTLDQQSVKGQLMDIQAWQVSPAVAKKLVLMEK
jgi:class 3 adenylate cyclase